MVITDHYYEGFFSGPGAWRDMAKRFLSGYHEAYDEASRLDFDVILGCEMRFTDHANDYLVYGITEDFIMEHPMLHRMTPARFKLLAAESGLVIYQAHPYRNGMSRAKPDHIDGVEVHNGNARHDSRNDRAKAFAAKHRLRELSGSDFHRHEDIARGGIVLRERVSDSAAFARAIVVGDFNLII